MLRVLVADDDESTKELIVSFIESLGHIVKGVSDGKQVLEAYKVFNPDLIVTDNRMGNGPSGIDVLTIIKEQCHNSLIVILTAYGDIEIAVKAMKLGAFDFVTKDMAFPRLKEILDKVQEIKKHSIEKLVENVSNVEKICINSLEELEKKTIKKAIDECETYQQAADKLGINIVTLHRKRKRFNLQKDEIKDAQQKVEKMLKKYFDKTVA